jgi:hypothetical protein
MEEDKLRNEPRRKGVKFQYFPPAGGEAAPL